ncbi:MAG TPA: hypothetical protein PK416_02090, partial [Thermodesulfobacteriota bacterium]|nr:hypothetical protein [Thermodesulfobacteriota bacterium]
ITKPADIGNNRARRVGIFVEVFLKFMIRSRISWREVPDILGQKSASGLIGNQVRRMFQPGSVRFRPVWRAHLKEFEPPRRSPSS